MDDHFFKVSELQTQIKTLLEIQLYAQERINELEKEKQKHEKYLQRTKQ